MSCDTKTGNCHTESCCETSTGNSSCSDSQTCCSPESASPIDHVAGLWKDAFFHAMKQAQVEALKARIIKNWGPMIDKEADAMIAAMGAKWEAMIAQVKAEEACNDFKGQLRDLWLQEKK